MGHKIITEEDFWICTMGAMPSPIQGTRKSLHDKKGNLYITKEDKATVSWIDFGCKKYMLLMALAAAAAVLVAVAVGVITVATGGAGLIVMCAIAGLAGGAIGAVIGGLLCGQKVASKRNWVTNKNDMILQGTPVITGGCTMICAAGGTVQYAPNIKSWMGAIAYARLSYTSELVKCAMAGALVGTVGSLLGVGSVAATGGATGTGVSLASRAVTLARPTVMSVLRNVGASFGIGTGATGAGIALGSRGIFGAESAAHTYATDARDENGNQISIADSFAKGALPEYELGNRIYNQGLSGLKPSDALLLLYLLNLKFDPKGTYRSPDGTLRNARGNPRGAPVGSRAADPRNPPKSGGNGKAFEDTKGGRPSWRQSEKDMAKKYPGYDDQKSFKDGKEVPYGTEGSTRPDLYKSGHSIEVKNYDVKSSTGRSNLKSELVRQYNDRNAHLPKGTKQTAEIDVRGQDVSPKELKDLKTGIQNEAPELEIIFTTD